MTEFFQTRMGQRFYERTVPDLVRQLERLNANLERITNDTEKTDDEDTHPQDPRADRG